MTRSIFVCLLSLLIAGPALAQVDNASFERWDGDTPSAWTTFDYGIQVSAANGVARDGSTSAAVNVLTTTQSSTDFRQRLQVTRGTSYSFSVWVMHTEGDVKARLFVDGYHDYSKPALVGQWQQLSHTYEADADGEIEVGLRFYADDTSFDGSEVVYVDDFQPAAAEVPDDDACDGGLAVVAITTDAYGHETSWTVTAADGRTLHEGSGYGNNEEIVETFCLPAGDYGFTIYDSYGDGSCCSWGQGSYALTIDGIEMASGGEFRLSESTAFTVSGGMTAPAPGPLTGYYESADGLSGYALKTALHNIIKDHQNRGYGAIWSFVDQYDRDLEYEADGSIFDIYSENPSGGDSYKYDGPSDQCGGYRVEGDCYNREHSFPRSWFAKAEPMNSDIHHIFPTDGYVNGRRSHYPYGEVGPTSFVSANGSKLGEAVSGLGYTGTVFEPLDEFKGDVARAYFYLATRYEDRIASWETITDSGDDVLDGTNDHVFESWFLDLLIAWHEADPVSDTERARNEGAFEYQGNRNPFVDHPELVDRIWDN